MKIYKLCMLVLFIGLTISRAGAQTDNPHYDKAMADSLGGDDYGMKAYVLAILKTGPIKIEDKKIVDSLFKGHTDNIVRLAAVKKIVVSGPIAKNEKNYRGIFILNVKTIPEAEELLKNDPAINAKLLDVELFRWFGSAALPEYLKIHDKIERKKM